MKIQKKTISAEETIQLGIKIGSKIQKGNIIEYWTELSIFLFIDDLIINNKNKSKTKNSNIINGLSISPKKTFCIIKHGILLYIY